MKPEKLQDLLLKLRKGADSGIKMPELVQVLEQLGFTFTEALVLRSENYGNPESFSHAHEQTARADWEQAKANEVQSLPKPAQLQKNKTYYLDVSELQQTPTGWFFTAQVWKAVIGTRVTAPNHQVFDSPKDFDQFLRGYPQNNGLLKWLKEDAKYLDLINDRLKTEPYEVERAKAKTPPRSRENTGTCPACFGNFKLVPRTKRGRDKTMPGMTLHGYKRPGRGTIHGNCLGQDWPPFELSPEGTLAFIDALERSQERLQGHLKRLQQGEVSSLPTTMNRMVDQDAVAGEVWKRLLEREVSTTESQIHMLEGDLKRLQQHVSTWKQEPLPQDQPVA
jgi:hypothetical protein